MGNGVPTPTAPDPHRPPSAAVSQDKAAVLADVRGIIAEQLGTDLEKVQPWGPGGELGAQALGVHAPRLFGRGGTRACGAGGGGLEIDGKG